LDDGASSNSLGGDGYLFSAGAGSGFGRGFWDVLSSSSISSGPDGYLLLNGGRGGLTDDGASSISKGSAGYLLLTGWGRGGFWDDGASDGNSGPKIILKIIIKLEFSYKNLYIRSGKG